MNWDALGRLREQGLAIGAHSRTHAWLTRVDATLLSEEVEGARDDLRERLGLGATVFCYPYGDLDARVEREVSRCYRWACSTELELLGRTPPAHRLPRLDAFYLRGPGQLEAFGSLPFRLRMDLRRPARALKRALRN
jgi:peptidoglycan/xylan/chitin deacetylase (PgdA/CDA1 family)